MCLFKARKIQSPLFLIFFLFAAIYCLISLVNHYQFRTYALDLGMFNQALYAFSQGQPALFTLDAQGMTTPFLATHFSPITFLYTPFYFVFGNYALLIIQILAILLGGLGIYRIAVEKLPSASQLPLLILIQFFCIWGIYSALAFDFHNNVVGAMLIPWLFYYLEKRKKFLAGLFWGLLLLCQETMAIWGIFFLLGFMILHRKNIPFRAYCKLEVPALLFSILYSILIIMWIMPVLQGQEHNLQFSRYQHLGTSFPEIIMHLLAHPVDVLKLLFNNPSGDSRFDGIKMEFHFMVLVSGGIFLLLRPAYLLMLMPIYAQKMLSADFAIWGINYQYSVEFVPIISLALISFIAEQKRYQLPLMIIVLLSTLFFNISKLDHRISKWYDKANSRFYAPVHYRSAINLNEAYKAIDLIPDGLPVSASSCFPSHLERRKQLYHFPVVKNARYIIVEKKGIHPFPMNKINYLKAITYWKKQSSFFVFWESPDILILKKK